MPSTETYAQIAAEVDNNSGVIIISMDRLRRIDNPNGRLGSNICSRIAKNLADEGLAHYPVNLPSYSHEDVTLFRRDSLIATVIDALGTRGKLRTLRAINTGDAATAEAALNKIREIVEGLDGQAERQAA